ncbi:YceI family protein [Dokdonia sp. Hel_I_53]|uniref:YceI family protein n=1 Tax=Dokdonia sp. Hel_I_53 TaxID=1566287 RepID=UPI00119BDC0F|nr:YceI family protein [Dokdonia sp. Hel_I_53]TVZ50995.1 polyisoprenoid-binding protein YceI [Dokdonia sp. Hel_I_53]
MKNVIKTSVLLLVTALLNLSFNTMNSEKKAIKLSESKVTWKGYKVTGSHQGTIDLTSGHLEFNEDVLTGGNFTIAMNTIVSTDLEGESKGQLEGHLKSDDFFGVATFPTATLNFTKVTPTGKNSYDVVGNLTIKGKTNPVTLVVSIYGNKANATLKVDRSKYDVRYGSTSFFDNLKDKAIYDEFDLIADLEF